MEAKTLFGCSDRNSFRRRVYGILPALHRECIRRLEHLEVRQFQAFVQQRQFLLEPEQCFQAGIHPKSGDYCRIPIQCRYFLIMDIAIPFDLVEQARFLQ